MLGGCDEIDEARNVFAEGERGVALVALVQQDRSLGASLGNILVLLATK